MTLVLAKALSPADVGLYSLLTAAVTLCVSLVGLEFHQFSSRELLRIKPEQQPPMIRDQLLGLSLSYLLWLPALYLSFHLDLLPSNLFGIFCLLLWLEHSSNEAFKIFTTQSRPILANLVFFLRNGCWPLLLIGIFLLNPNWLSLNLIWTLWVLGGLASLLLALGYLWPSLLKSRRNAINWPWLGRGLKVSLWFLLAAFCNNVQQFGDRFIIDAYLNRELLGVYSLYWALINVISLLVVTGVLNLQQQAVIRHFSQKNYHSAAQGLERMHRDSMRFSILAVACCLLFNELILLWLNKPIYSENRSAILVLALVPILTQCSVKAHFKLYLHHQDRQIFTATLLACGIQTLCNFVTIPAFGITGASLAAVLGALSLSLSKLWFARSLPD